MANMVLFDDYPIMVDRVLAKEIGLNEAIVLQQVHYWIQFNQRTGNNFKDGRYWTFNSMTKWHEETFYFWSFNTLRRTFKSLEEKGILISGNFNKKGYDRTKWYAINYEKLASMHCNNSLAQNGHIQLPKMGTSISPKWAYPLAQNGPTNTRDYTETTEETITTTEVVVSKQKQAIKDILSQKYKDGYTEDFIDRVDKRLSDKKMSIEAFKEKVEMSLKDGINNRNGYLLQAIKNDYKEVKSKKNKFNFDGNIDYSDKELMDKIMKSQERKYGEA